ncbi:MAG: FAD-binding protein [Treponema sp.]|jgi:succinate dehydrogenase/fumarate reductase flavoprotein subunit|nr:FAD-binding protein [Treponema sp.]
MTFLGKEASAHEGVFDCLIIGSGAAAYNAALHLFEKGVVNFAVITENRLDGTSRNTGSDKQTYYKIACAGDQKDSPGAMAQTLFAGGSMDGDIALCEAAHSLEEFFHLVSIGVDFPHNRYGEYAGYKTDHDPLQRASSIGPYTSKKMTEKLEQAAYARNIAVIDRTRAVKILADGEGKRAYGLLCLEAGSAYKIYFSKNIIFACGGPPGLYENTVYPQSQFGSSGVLAREGAVFSNITEWQYGIGSVKFRWNLSGSYQQVIPRYVSVDGQGREEEFLSAYFSSPQKMSRAVFLKGYQWPFDPAKIANEGSSLVDMAIYMEKYVKGRKVFLDFTRNHAGLALDAIDETAREYLAKSDALCSNPLERLLRLNPLSYELYKSNGIDLANEYLEIDVLPQHHNGGAEVSIWWETSIKHLFAIGECAGTHGIYRPGGSALNSGQVGGLRAASYIAGHYLRDNAADTFFDDAALSAMTARALAEFERELNAAPPGAACESASDVLHRLQEINTRTAMFIRSRRDLEKSRDEIKALSEKKLNPADAPAAFFRFREMLLFSRLLHDGILSYIQDGGKSRGSYLIVDSMQDIAVSAGGVEIDAARRDKVINTAYNGKEDLVASSFRLVRPIPESDTWFETVWRDFREGTIYKRSELVPKTEVLGQLRSDI